jgi:hypothetical protein
MSERDSSEKSYSSGSSRSSGVKLPKIHGNKL